MAAKVGEILIKQGLIVPEALVRALDESKKSGLRLTQILIQQGAVKELQVLKALESFYQVPGVDLNNFTIQAGVAQMVPREICEKHLMIPVQKVGQTLVVAFSDPGNIFIRDDLRFLTRSKIQAVVATETAVAMAIDKYFGSEVGAIIKDSVDETNSEDDIQVAINEVIRADTDSDEGPIIKFVNLVLTDAIRKKVSDIHFEPYENRFRVRFRVDGSMVEATSQPVSSGPAIVSRIKIMSKLNIAEKRRPQDGRIKIRYRGGKGMDFRVSVLPTIWGEKIVMRLLDMSNIQLDMARLGMETEDLAFFKEAIHRPQGLVLITGPTGSGKTTTIYSALADLNQPNVNISTAEDPVEFNFEGINQVQVNPDIELSFATALRSFLRQDPDIIMVGEIRDLETAEIAMKAASTGHLVVSTLHTNDAAQTVSRLTEMGVPPYIVASTLTLVVSQRLVGRVCENCRTPFEVAPKVLIDIGADPTEVNEYRLFKGKGCHTCSGTGIKGRVAIFEVMKLSEKIGELILNGASAADLRKMARVEGMKTLRRSALLKLKRGETTIEEVVNTSVRDY